MLTSSPADRRQERPLPYAIAFCVLGIADFCALYRLAETPMEFLVILGLLASTFIVGVEALARID